MSATLPDERVEPAPDAPAFDIRVGAPRTVGRRFIEWVAGNRLFCLALVCGAALRVLVAVAYAPAIEFFGDSYNYLEAARRVPQVDIWHPILYPVVIRVVSVTHSLTALTMLQHVAGLVTAVLIYRLVRTFGGGSVAGTIATLPVLLDAYQVNIEQYVLSEALFTLLLVIALRACTKVTSKLTTSSAVSAGLLLAALTLTRTVGVVVFAVALVYLLLSRVGWWHVGVVAAAFAVPVLIYALGFRATFGVTGLQGYGGRYAYGTVAPYVKCAGMRLSHEERLLCPGLPTYARPGFNQYVWDASPYRKLTGDAFLRSAVAGRFAHTVMLHQPRATASTIEHNLAHYFVPGRGTTPRDWFIGSWQFPLPERSPAWHVEPAYFGYGARPGTAHGHIVLGLAYPLRRYQALMFAPGPLLLLCVLLTAGALLLRGHRDRPSRLLAGLLAAAGVVLLLAPATSAGFDWRYLLPAQAVLAPAGALAFVVARSRLPSRLPDAVVPGVATAVVLAGLSSNLVAPSVYAATQLRVRLTAAAPASLPIGTSLRVHVGRAKAFETACVTGPDGSRWRTLTAFPVAATFRSGSPVLVQPSNFDLAGYEGTNGPFAPRAHLAQLLPDVLLGPRYRQVTGTIFVDLTRPSGRLDYVDPRGAGAAGWSFRVNTREGDRARMGKRCTPRTTWRGEVVHTLRVLRLSPFTELATQRVTYGLTWYPARARTFDLRWRQGSAQAGFAAWQYPPAWRRTTARSQRLVNLEAGYTYCFSVRARDRHGIATAWSPPQCTVRMSDDTNLIGTPDWRRVLHQPGFYLGSYSESSALGATLTTAGTYSRIGLVAYRCPACGVLQVYSGTRLVRSLDLASGHSRSGLFAWISPPFATARSGPVTLRVASRGRPVIVDAFGLQR